MKPRAYRDLVVAKVDGRTVEFDDGTCWSPPDEYFDRIARVGGHFVMETIQHSRVVGMSEVSEDGDSAIEIYSKSDEEIAEESRQFSANMDARNEKRWLADKEDFLTRRDALPLALRRRMDLFHNNGKHAFELSGFGYELVICELAVLYAADDTEGVDELADKEGTTGNQHDCAESLAKLLKAGKPITGFPAGFTPLTGDPFYKRAGAS